VVNIDKAESLPFKVAEQIMWLDRNHCPVRFKTDTGSCSVTERKSVPGGALRSLVLRTIRQAHLFIEEFGESKGEKDAKADWWEMAIKELHQGKPMPPFTRELLKALVMCTVQSRKSVPGCIAQVPEEQEKAPIAKLAAAVVNGAYSDTVINDLSTVNSEALVEEIVRELIRKH
jgi:hypothetical protein